MIFALDIGTSYIKTALIDRSGNSFNPKRVLLNSVKDNDLMEIDPVEWTSGFYSVFEEYSREHNIEAIVISGNGPTVVPVDRDGKNISNAMLWMDTRAKSVSRELDELLGYSVPPNFFISKIFWYKKHLPEIYENAKEFLSCPEFLCSHLTGKSYTLLPSEGYLKFYWNSDMLHSLDISEAKLPPFIDIDKVWGEYKGIPVVCGGPDFIMSVLGSGSVEEGILCDRTGTSEGLNFCSSNLMNIKGIRTLPHIIPGLYTLAGLIPDSGKLLSSGDIDKLIEKYSKIVENFKSNGIDIKEVRVIGGHSLIEELNRRKYRVVNTPVRFYSSGAELVGNGALGYYVLGEYSSLKEAAMSMVKEFGCIGG